MNEPLKRNVPASALIEFCFAGFAIQLVYLFLAGMLFVLKPMYFTEAQALYYFNSHELTQTKGTITAITRIEREESPDAFEIQFKFKDDFDVSYSNYSYNRMSWHKIGQEVDVEYVLTNPEFARIHGMRFQLDSNFSVVFFVLLFFIMLAMPLLQIIKGLKAYSLLKNGTFGHASFVRQEETSTKVNEETVYRMYFQLPVETFDGKPFQLSYRSRHTDELKLKQKYPAFYNPEVLSQSIVLPMMPGNVQASSSGEIQSPALLLSAFWLIFPVCFVIILAFV